MENPTKKILLAVLAHPDDETFGTGGSLAFYSSKGIEVHLVCATRGEAGDVSQEMMQGYNSVAELRESELRCAAGHLGLTGVHFLDYRDSGMQGSPDNTHPQALAAADIGKVTGEVVHYIRLLKPQVVITFDPIGGYMHPDHIAIQKATEKAFFAAGDTAQYASDLPAFQPNKLYFHTFPRGFLSGSRLVDEIFRKGSAKIWKEWRYRPGTCCRSEVSDQCHRGLPFSVGKERYGNRLPCQPGRGKDHQGNHGLVP